MRKHPYLWGVLLAAMLVFGGTSQGTVIFTDNFSSGPGASWGNERGSWFASGGVYDTTSPSNAPLTLSTLPFSLTDFEFDVDINDVADGGVWLRSDATGANAVLLVTGGRGWGSGISSGGRSLYWHTISGGSASGILEEVTDVFTNPGLDDVHLHITVVGDTYSVFLNGSPTAATSLTYAGLTGGRVGLYDYSVQTFDNVALNDLSVQDPGSGVVPEPQGLALLAIGLLGIVYARRSPN